MLSNTNQSTELLLPKGEYIYKFQRRHYLIAFDAEDQKIKNYRVDKPPLCKLLFEYAKITYKMCENAVLFLDNKAWPVCIFIKKTGRQFDSTQNHNFKVS